MSRPPQGRPGSRPDAGRPEPRPPREPAPPREPGARFEAGCGAEPGPGRGAEPGRGPGVRPGLAASDSGARRGVAGTQPGAGPEPAEPEPRPEPGACAEAGRRSGRGARRGPGGIRRGHAGAAKRGTATRRGAGLGFGGGAGTGAGRAHGQLLGDAAHAAGDGAGARLLAPLLEAAPGASTVAVAARHGGRRVLAVAGTTAHGGGRAADPHTRFEVGSITKTFTALLLADMVSRGEVRHTDPISRYLPRGVTPRGGEGITLLHLATHTSGLPGLPPGILRRAAPRWFTNPYASFSAEELLPALTRARPHPAPGTRVRYSNFGVALLGLLLARAAGMAYEELLATRVLAPLDLADTGCEDDEHRATGYWHGRPRPGWRMPGLPAAGALRSSAHDLLRYLEAHLAALPAEAGPGPHSPARPVPREPVPEESVPWQPVPDAGMPGAGVPDAVMPGAVPELVPAVAERPPYSLPEPLPEPGPLGAALADVAAPRLAVRSGGDLICLVWNARRRPGHQLYFHSGGTRGCTSFVGFSPQRRVAFAALANTSPSLDGAFIQRSYLSFRELAAAVEGSVPALD